jgi:hypothetical protein
VCWEISEAAVEITIVVVWNLQTIGSARLECGQDEEWWEGEEMRSPSWTKMMLIHDDVHL